MEGLAVLIVAATPAEIAPVVAALGPGSPADTRTSSHTFHQHTIDVLTSGVGMVPTAAWTTRALVKRRYAIALNFGVCGSFDGTLVPGQVVHVVSDVLAEVGAEDGDAFLDLAALNLAGEDLVTNEHPPANAALGALPRVTGITVNTVHGSERSIAAIVDRLHPQIESMEGASFMYACRINDVPFAQVRAVSNTIERRNRTAWKLPDAVAALGRAALDILAAL